MLWILEHSEKAFRLSCRFACEGFDKMVNLKLGGLANSYLENHWSET